MERLKFEKTLSKLIDKLLFGDAMAKGILSQNKPPVTDSLRYMKLLNIPQITDSFIRFLKPKPDLKIVKYNKLSIADLFHKLKDKTPNELISNTVYKIPCMGCHNSYIGQSSQWLKHRITQHKSDAKLNKRTCALAIHSNDFDHAFDFGNTTILDTDCNKRRRLFKEMYHIKNSDSINFKSDTNNTSGIYAFVFHTLTSKQNSN